MITKKLHCRYQTSGKDYSLLVGHLKDGLTNAECKTFAEGLVTHATLFSPTLMGVKKAELVTRETVDVLA